MNVFERTKYSGQTKSAVVAKAACRAGSLASCRRRSKNAAPPSRARTIVESRSAACDSPNAAVNGMAHNHCPRSGHVAQR